MHAQSALATRWGSFVARRRWWFLGAWILLVAGMSYLAAGTASELSPLGFEAKTESSRAADILHAQFPERQAPVLYAVFEPPAGVRLGDASYQAQVTRWHDELRRLAPAALTVGDPIPGQDGRTSGILVQATDSPDKFLAYAKQVRAIHVAGPAKVYLGGLAPIYQTFIQDSQDDLRQSELYSLPISVVLLLLVFGGLVAGVLPVVTGAATVTVAVALLGLVARAKQVSVFSLDVSSVVGLGLGIDYSLLVVYRFREELRRGRSREDAVAVTVGTAGVATVISGGTVAIGFGSLLTSRLNVLWSMGLGGALVVAVSVLASLTLIPALLAVFGSKVDRLALPFLHGRDTSRWWHALATGVMRRPLLFIGGVLVVMGVLALPARSLDLGVVGTESLPSGDPARTAQQLATEHLGFPAYSPVLIVAEGVSDPETAALVENRLRAAAGGRPVTGINEAPAAAQAAYLRPPYALYQAVQPGPDNSNETRSFLDGLRRTAAPPGVRLLVGGEAAAYQDVLGVLAQDFPKALALVLGLTLVLLGVSLRSVALPLKAVLMNLISVTAAMGVLTFVFQEGHFSDLLGFTATGFIDGTIPVVIFAGLFGLSMDYEVFLLTRVREEYARGRDNTGAVAAGMERTGQIITSAALILVVVVGSLAISHLALNKALGLTFAVAVFLDATLIRLLLVPAFMRVLGNLNWWPGGRHAATGKTEAEAAAG